MRKWKLMDRRFAAALAAAALVFLTACGSEKTAVSIDAETDTETETRVDTETKTGTETRIDTETNTDTEIKTDAETGMEAEISRETAEDGSVDFALLQAGNPDIFAWLYIPGTAIDCPVLQSGESDDYYETHDAFGNENTGGAVYTEMANLTDMTDFNTVLHGKSDGQNGNFADLYQYTDPEFFEKNDKIYIFLDGNLLTYEIFAAYEREDDSLIRRYNFTSAEGCNAFLEDLYAREIGKQIREGWEGITCNHFLITLTTKADEQDDRQFVVIGALVEDAAGKINREVMN